MEKIPHTSYVSILLHLKFGGFGIGYGIGRKYQPIRVSVLVSDLNQNRFGRSLYCCMQLPLNSLMQCVFVFSVTESFNSTSILN